MVSFQNIEVNVKCGHHRAAEYLDDDNPVDEPGSINRYVEVKSNEYWRVKGTIGRDFDWQDADVVVMRVYLDGKYSTGACLMKPKPPSIESVRARVNGAWASSSKFLRYKFADLETRDLISDDDQSKFKELYQELGTITVTFRREKDLGSMPSISSVQDVSLQPIPEKGLKGRPILVATTYEAIPRTRMTESLRTLPLNKVAVFNLKYRTRRALQSLLIIPRSASPLPVEERAVEELSRGELMELERRRRAEDEIQRQKVKRERADSEEITMPPLKTSKGRNAQVVYHIDSDDEQATQTPPEASATASAEVNEGGHESEVEEVTLL